MTQGCVINWPKGVSWIRPKVISLMSRSQCTHTQNHAWAITPQITPCSYGQGQCHTLHMMIPYTIFVHDPGIVGAAVVEWLSSWLAEQEDRGSIPGLATWIFRDWLSPASKSRYGWKIAKSTLILKTTNQPTQGLLLRNRGGYLGVFVPLGHV